MARRRTSSDTWHICSNCSQWPTSDYETGDGRTGEKCSECREKRKSGTCTEG
ncbi:hypothetical protein BH18ACT4_BH18ACT4_11690 [soil metagenome]